MSAPEFRIDQQRRRLSVLVSGTHARIAQAARLLEHKAAAAPKSAEADARKILLGAQDEIERWLAEAGELVGVEWKP